MFPHEQCRQALAAQGFDLGCKFLHAYEQHRDSLVYDLMELYRPAVAMPGSDGRGLGLYLSPLRRTEQ
jgi:hypothetical protein